MCIKCIKSSQRLNATIGNRLAERQEVSRGCKHFLSSNLSPSAVRFKASFYPFIAGYWEHGRSLPSRRTVAAFIPSPLLGYLAQESRGGSGYACDMNLMSIFFFFFLSASFHIFRGNWIGEAPYKTGRPCSECPPSYGGNCKNNLCYKGKKPNCS